MEVVVITDRGQLRHVAGSLADTPEAVISIHLLRRGLCRAHLVGSPQRREALVIESDEMPGEPMCFGDNPHAIWFALGSTVGWWAANVPEELAETIGRLAEHAGAEQIHFLGDIYHTLTEPVPEFCDPAVRLLTLDDLALLEDAPKPVRGGGYGRTSVLLREGIVAGAIVDGRIVATAHTSAQSERYADIGVATLPGYRGRGIATVAASLVASRIQAAGRIPVWSCGETNAPSLQVARKLGFRPVGFRVYVVVERSGRRETRGEGERDRDGYPLS